MYQETMSQAQEFLKSAQRGMDVYGPDGNRIGKVADIYFANDTVEETMSGAAADLDGLHDAVKKRLLQSGFIKIETGFLRADRYALADQLTYVNAEAVYLDVGTRGLVKA